TQGSLYVNSEAGLYGSLTFDWTGSGDSPKLIILNHIAFNAGSSINVTQENAGLIYLGGDVFFNAGSNLNMTGGFLQFAGIGNSHIRTSAPTTIHHLVSSKEPGYDTLFLGYNDACLTIGGNLEVYAGSTLGTFYSEGYTTIPDICLKGNLSVDPGGTCALDHGTLSLEGVANSSFNLGDAGNYVHDLRIYKTGTFNYTVTLHSDIDVRGDLVIDDGILETRVMAYPSNFYYDLLVGGDWDNNAGTGAFKEYSSMSVTLNGTGEQILSTETFSNLILDKPGGNMFIPAGSNVICTSYDWVHGAYQVDGGTFSANDLADNGIWGDITLFSGTINYHQDTNAGSTVDLQGDLTIVGGVFNVFGGAGDSWWTGSLTMVGGTLDFCDVGIYIPY
ncbi:MAG: hypothetical protein ACP5F3_08060, partial [Candidatus Syntrophosphaera sp.]